MYVAVRSVILHQAGFRTIREGLEALGLDAVELALSRDLSILLPDTALVDRRFPLTTPEAVAEARARYDDVGVHITGLLLANNFNAEDKVAEVEWVVQAVRIAEGLGADAVRIDSAMTGQQELPLAARVAIYADAVRQVLQATPDSTVPLAIENHGYQGNDPQWLQAVLDAANSPRVGVTLDTGNFYWAGLPLGRVYEAIAQFAPYVKHTHCKNIRFNAEQREAHRVPGWGYGEHVCPLPDGDIDHRRVARMLWEAGYQGGLTIEDESLGRFVGDERRVQLQRDVEYLAEIALSVGGSRLYHGSRCACA